MLSTLRERGFFHLVMANAAAQAIAFAAGLVLTKLLSPEDLGSARIVQSYFTVLVVIGGVGLGAAVLKFASENRPETERRGIWSAAIRRTLVSGTLGALVLAAVSILVGVSPHPEVSLAMAVYAAGAPFSIAADLTVQFLQSQGRAKSVAGLTVVNRAMVAAVTLTGAAIFGLMGWVVAGVVAWALSFALMATSAGWGGLRESPFWPKGMSTFSRYALLGNIVYAINQNVDFMILDFLVVDRKEIGIYAFAALFLIAATQLTGAMQAIVIPHLSARYREIEWVRTEALRTQALFAGGAVVAAILIQGLVWAAIQIGYPEFESAMRYSLVLMLRFVLAASGAVCGAAIFALGQIRLNVIAVGLGMVAGVTSGILLTLEYGVMGVAWGQAIGGAVVALGQWGAFHYALRHASADAEPGSPVMPSGD